MKGLVGKMQGNSLKQEGKTKEKGKKKSQKRTMAIILVVAVIGAGTFAYLGRNRTQANSANADMATYTVARGNISETLSGSGTLEPADSYTVTTLVTGDILSADFEEGDIVDKDTLLYLVDSSDVENELVRSENSLAQSARNYTRMVESMDDLNVKATESGRVTSFDVKIGDNISAGQVIATIEDTDTMTLTLPFIAEDAKQIAVGDTALVTLGDTFEVLEGRVTDVYAVDLVQTGNVIAREVKIEVANPGGITPETQATATIGTLACLESSTFTYKSEGSVMALVSGEVKAIQVNEGDYVHKDEVLVVMKSDALSDNLQDAAYARDNAKLTLENQQEQLDNYSITSPIYGTIIEKNYKAGDTISSNTGTLCTIYDLSYLTMTLNVDELDITKIKVGQTVSVTADAVEGSTYEGIVTKINIKGTTSNGVTSYPVTVRIDNTDGLLPGMNVDAEIIVGSSEDALVVPISAVMRGNRVLLESNDTPPSDTASLPEGYAYVTVETGLSDDNFIEILSGLSEGDVIMYSESVSPASSGFSEPFANGGGMRRDPMDGPGGGGF